MMAAKAKSKPSPAPELPAPTETQAKAIKEARERMKARPARASMTIKAEMTGARTAMLNISNPHTDGKGWAAHIDDTFGTASNAFAQQSLMRLVGVLQTRDATASEADINGALALLGAIAPRDELETAIGEQIIGAHVLAMNLTHNAKCADTIPKMEAYVNMATKVSRTMAAHVETLGKLRSGGKQTHEVRHVYINGNAVIGDHAQTVFRAGGLRELHRISGQPFGPAAIASLEATPGLPMPGEDAARDALPIARDARSQTLSDSRRGGGVGRTDREGERPLSDGTSHSGTAGSPPAGSRHRQRGQGAR